MNGEFPAVTDILRSVPWSALAWTLLMLCAVSVFSQTFAGVSFSSVAAGGITFVSSDQNDNSAAQDITITKPTGLQNDDILLAYVGVQEDGGDWTAPAGWVEEYDVETATQNDRQMALFTKKITNAAGEPANYLFDPNQGVNREIHGAILAFRGVDTTTHMDATSVTTFNINDPTPDSPSITTVTNDAMVISYCWITQSASIVIVVPTSGFTMAESLGSSFDRNFGTAYDIQESSGASGAINWPNTGGDSASDFGCSTAALRPA